MNVLSLSSQIHRPFGNAFLLAIPRFVRCGGVEVPRTNTYGLFRGNILKRDPLDQGLMAHWHLSQHDNQLRKYVLQ